MTLKTTKQCIINREGNATRKAFDFADRVIAQKDRFLSGIITSQQATREINQLVDKYEKKRDDY